MRGYNAVWRSAIAEIPEQVEQQQGENRTEHRENDKAQNLLADGSAASLFCVAHRDTAAIVSKKSRRTNIMMPAVGSSSPRSM